MDVDDTTAADTTAADTTAADTTADGEAEAAEAGYTEAGLSRRSRRLITSGVLALAVTGYLVGLRAGVPEGRPGVAEAARASATTPPDGDVLPAMTYAEVGAGGLRAARERQTWREMTALLRAPEHEPVIDRVTREASLRQRAERRAYNGAPPVIPHAAQGLDSQACLACHGQQFAIGGRTARDLPHPYLTNCTQCHAVAAPDFLRPYGGLLSGSNWQGIAAPREGARAMPGAPPAVPHSLQMRDNCLACHGPQGWLGMQTSHPERRSCLQCHAPTQDRAHPGKALRPPFLLPPPRVEAR